MEQKLLRIAIVILAVIILISAVALLLRSAINKAPKPTEEPSQENVQPAEPVKDPEPVKEDTKENTPAEEPKEEPKPEEPPKEETKPEEPPEEEPEPEEQPKEEPKPEEEEKQEIKPVIDRDVDSSSILSSGSFHSETDTSLTLTVNWYVVKENGEEKLLLDIDLSAFSLQVGSRSNGITAVVNGKTYQFDSEEVDYEESGLLTTVDLAYCEIPYDGTPANVFVGWSFWGIYSGVEMDTVTAEGYVS